MTHCKRNVCDVRREAIRTKKDDLSVSTAPKELGLLATIPRTLLPVEV